MVATYPVSDRFKVTYNGIDLSYWLNVSDVVRNVGQNRKATLQKVGRSDGKHFSYTSADESTITVKGDLDGDDSIALAKKRHELAAAIATDEPARLTFEDEPGMYYDAICDGQTTATEDQFLGDVTITFVVPDGLAHATQTKTFEQSADGSITVVNRGTNKAWPVITATMNGDNGVLGISTSAGGTARFGSPDEVDGQQHDDSEIAFHWDFMSAPDGAILNAGPLVYPNYLGDASKPNKQAGSFDYTLTKDTATPVYARTSADYWAGPSLTNAAVPSNSQGSSTGNIICANRINVVSSVAAVGRAEFTLSNADNKLIAAIVLRDSNMAADMLSVDCVCENQTLYTQDLDRSVFVNGFYELKITKLGGNITWQIGGIKTLEGWVNLNTAIFTRSAFVDGLADEAITKFTGWLAGFSDKTGWTINWSDSLFEWINVDYYQDLPNHFKSGDVVVLDTDNRSITVNGAEDGTLQDIANHWGTLALPPGETVLTPYCSDWATLFSCTVEIREAFV